MNLNKYIEAVKDKFSNLSELEMKVKEATNSDRWGMANTTLMQITKEAEFNCGPVFNIVDTRLASSDYYNVYKSLNLLEFMIKHSERLKPQIDAKYSRTINKLATDFYKNDDKGKDVGINVRIKSKNVLDMLNNTQPVQDKLQVNVQVEVEHESAKPLPKSPVVVQDLLDLSEEISPTKDVHQTTANAFEPYVSLNSPKTQQTSERTNTNDLNLLSLDDDYGEFEGSSNQKGPQQQNVVPHSTVPSHQPSSFATTKSVSKNSDPLSILNPFTQSVQLPLHQLQNK